MLLTGLETFRSSDDPDIAVQADEMYFDLQRTGFRLNYPSAITERIKESQERLKLLKEDAVNKIDQKKKEREEIKLAMKDKKISLELLYEDSVYDNAEVIINTIFI